MESEEWRVELVPASGVRFVISGIRVLRDLIHREAVPLLLQGEGLNALEKGYYAPIVERYLHSPLSTLHSHLKFMPKTTPQNPIRIV